MNKMPLRCSNTDAEGTSCACISLRKMLLNFVAGRHCNDLGKHFEMKNNAWRAKWVRERIVSDSWYAPFCNMCWGGKQKGAYQYYRITCGWNWWDKQPFCGAAHFQKKSTTIASAKCKSFLHGSCKLGELVDITFAKSGPSCLLLDHVSDTKITVLMTRNIGKFLPYHDKTKDLRITCGWHWWDKPFAHFQ